MRFLPSCTIPKLCDFCSRRATVSLFDPSGQTCIACSKCYWALKQGDVHFRHDGHCNGSKK